MKKQRALCFALLALISLLIISTSKDTQVQACYGPHITADISKTEVNLNETVIITGEICPPEPNVTVRVTFTRPDYTWIDQFVTPDPETGKFTVTQTLDMVGYWNIFPIYGHLSDRLYANVTDPNAPDTPLPTPTLPPYKPNISLVTVAAISITIGAVRNSLNA